MRTPAGVGSCPTDVVTISASSALTTSLDSIVADTGAVATDESGLTCTVTSLVSDSPTAVSVLVPDLDTDDSSAAAVNCHALSDADAVNACTFDLVVLPPVTTLVCPTPPSQAASAHDDSLFATLVETHWPEGTPVDDPRSIECSPSSSATIPPADLPSVPNTSKSFDVTCTRLSKNAEACMFSVEVTVYPGVELFLSDDASESPKRSFTRLALMCCFHCVCRTGCELRSHARSGSLSPRSAVP